MSDEERSGPLKGQLGFFALTVYGVGGMLGGGIYVLVGRVAGDAGMWTWASFLAAMVVAAPTALAYAELGSRYPRSGGESRFVKEAFGRDHVAFLVGWTVAFSGLVSMATLAHGFAGYLRDFWPVLPAPVVVTAFLVTLAAISVLGVRLTSRAFVIATGVALTGLVLVVIAGWFVLTGGASSAGAAPGVADTLRDIPEGLPVLGIVHGATLAFYAFIGFQDTVDMAEEAERPRRHLPAAIILSLVLVGLMYVAVSLVATAAVAPATLDRADAPLSLVVAEGLPGLPGPVFTIIALLAVGNTALLNFVMASRLTYGMAEQELLPGWLGPVHEGRRTPHRAVVVLALLALGFALSGSLETLAATTSLLLLAVFFLVNLSLLVIQNREGPDPDAFRVPGIVPGAGMALSVGLAAFGATPSVAMATAILGVGVLIMAILALRA